MRKTLIVGIGLASLALFLNVASAVAKPRRCDIDSNGKQTSEEFFEKCMAEQTKEHDINSRHYGGPNSPFKPGRSDQHPGSGGNSGKGAGGKGGKGGKVTDDAPPQRQYVSGPYSIVYGGVNDKESEKWWNGKWTTVVMSDGSTLQVKQRIPGGAFVRERVNGQWTEVELRKTVNGVSYNVADPAYAHAVVFVKQHPAGTVEEANKAKSAIVHDHRIGNAASTSSNTPRAVISTGGSAPPAVRDHRPGGNALDATKLSGPGASGTVGGGGPAAPASSNSAHKAQ